MKKYLISFLFFCCFIIGLVPVMSSAATSLTVHTFPDESNLLSIKTRNTLKLNQSTLKNWEWHGVDGIEEIGTVGTSAAVSYTHLSHLTLMAVITPEKTWWSMNH